MTGKERRILVEAIAEGFERALRRLSINKKALHPLGGEYLPTGERYEFMNMGQNPHMEPELPDASRCGVPPTSTKVP